MNTSVRLTYARGIFGVVALTLGMCGSAFAETPEPNRGAGIEVRTAPASPASDKACAAKTCGSRSRIRSSNGPSDGRTGGTSETSARTPGGPPDDVNAGLTFALPSISKDWL
jgi:hypothetical protein